MSQEFEITTFRPEHVGELAAFLKEEYHTGEIADEKYLSWEYLENPSGKAIVTTAKAKDLKIVSQYALAPVLVYADGEILQAALSLNTLTDKHYRGKGLFLQTATAAFSYCASNGYVYTYGIPNSNSYAGFVKRLLFMDAGNLVFMARPLQPTKIISSMLNRSVEKKGGEIGFLADETELSKNSVSELTFPSDESRYRDFLNLWKDKGYISIYHSAEYLNWRYVQNPSRNYTLLKIVHGNEIKAIAVIRTMHVYGMKVCVVLDHRSMDKIHSKKLLDIIAGQSKKNNLDMMIAVASHKDAVQCKQLRFSGFWSIPEFLLPQRLPFIMRFHKETDKVAKLKDLKNWHFGFGDYDIF